MAFVEAPFSIREPKSAVAFDALRLLRRGGYNAWLRQAGLFIPEKLLLLRDDL